jgi:hypothetical protein
VLRDTASAGTAPSPSLRAAVHGLSLAPRRIFGSANSDQGQAFASTSLRRRGQCVIKSFPAAPRYDPSERTRLRSILVPPVPSGRGPAAAPACNPQGGSPHKQFGFPVRLRTSGTRTGPSTCSHSTPAPSRLSSTCSDDRLMGANLLGRWRFSGSISNLRTFFPIYLKMYTQKFNKPSIFLHTTEILATRPPIDRRRSPATRS